MEMASQNIVKNLGKESTKGLTNGLREFIKVDNERALDVGSLSRGTRTFQVRKPKVPGGCSEVIVRESPDDLTLRAEEVGTSKALMHVDHIEQEGWGPPLVDADWYAFCQALYEGIEGEAWEDMYESYKGNEQGCGSKEAAGVPQSKSFVGHEAAKDRRDISMTPARRNDISRRTKNAIGVVGRTSQGSNCCDGQGMKVRGTSVLELARGFVEHLRCSLRCTLTRSGPLLSSSPPSKS